MDNSEKKLSKRRVKAALAILLAVVFVISGGVAIRRYIQFQEAERAAQEALELAGRNTPAPTLAPTPGPVPTPDPEPEDTVPPDPTAEALAGLDIGALQAENGDVLGWIEIPGTELSYPLLQAEDNEYYLTHNWKKEPNSAGSIFLECTNAPDLSGYHTIVYGHRMTTDAMFGTLKYYSGPAYREEHPSVYIAMPDGVYRYDIFAAFTAHVRSMVYRLDLPGKEAEFVEFCLESSEIDTGIVPAPEDRILTMSTCVDMGQSDYRWVVQGRLAQVYSAKPTAEE